MVPELLPIMQALMVEIIQAEGDCSEFARLGEWHIGALRRTTTPKGFNMITEHQALMNEHLKQIAYLIRRGNAPTGWSWAESTESAVSRISSLIF